LTLRRTNAPANDDFDRAELLRRRLPLASTGSNVDATREPGEPRHVESAFDPTSDTSVWYEWTPRVDELVAIETCGSDFVTALVVYTGTRVDALTQVAGDLESARDCGSQSRLVLDAAAGTQYRIGVTGLFDAVGRIRLAIRPITLPPNDAFANAQVIRGNHLPRTTTGNTIGATAEPDEPRHAGFSAESSVWYRWTPEMSGPVVVETCDSAFDSELGVYTGSALAALTTVAGSDNRCDDDGKVLFTATAGETYQIAVDSVGHGDLRLTIRRPRPPANDDFAHARVIRGSLPTTVVANTVDATREPDEPLHSAISNGSAWFAWTAPTSGEVTFDTVGAPIPTSLAVYTGTAVDALTRVASANDGLLVAGAALHNDPSRNRVTFFAVAGRTYHIAVAGHYQSTVFPEFDSGQEARFDVHLAAA
jgi:hypothetical protein